MLVTRDNLAGPTDTTPLPSLDLCVGLQEVPMEIFQQLRALYLVARDRYGCEVNTSEFGAVRLYLRGDSGDTRPRIKIYTFCSETGAHLFGLVKPRSADTPSENMDIGQLSKVSALVEAVRLAVAEGL